MPKFKPQNPRGFDCVNVLVQRAIGKVMRRVKATIRKRAWDDANRERIRETSAALYKKKREQRIAETTEYRKKNREHLKACQVKREKERRETDPAYATAVLLRQRLRGALQRDVVKADTTMKLVGLSASDVTAHLQAQWQSEKGKFEIDHIFPFRYFDLTTEDGQRRAMHYSNLQPLGINENRSKWEKLPTKAMAAKVARWAWPDGVTEDMLPDIYDGWSTPLRM